MLKISYTDCYGLSPAFSAQFIFKMCVAARNRKKSLKPFISKVQGRSGSSMLIPLNSWSLVLVMISSMPVPIYNRFHARPANCGKIRTFRGVPLFDAFVRGEPLHPGARKIVTKN